MIQNEKDYQSLNGEVLRKMSPTSDFLPEEFDPAVIGVDEVTQAANKAAMDVLIDKPDAKLKEFVQTLSLEERNRVIDNITIHISDYRFLITHLTNKIVQK